MHLSLFIKIMKLSKNKLDIIMITIPVWTINVQITDCNTKTTTCNYRYPPFLFFSFCYWSDPSSIHFQSAERAHLHFFFSSLVFVFVFLARWPPTSNATGDSLVPSEEPASQLCHCSCCSGTSSVWWKQATCWKHALEWAQRHIGGKALGLVCNYMA